MDPWLTSRGCCVARSGVRTTAIFGQTWAQAWLNKKVSMVEFLNPNAFYTSHSTIYSSHFTLKTLHFTLYSVSTLYIHSALCTPHSTPYTRRNTNHILHSTAYTAHFTPHTLRFKLHTLQSRLYTLGSTPITPHPLHTLSRLTLYTKASSQPSKNPCSFRDRHSIQDAVCNLQQVHARFSPSATPATQNDIAHLQNATVCHVRPGRRRD